MWDHSFRDLFLRGGPVMWPLLGLSILTVAVLIDRMLTFALIPASLSGLLHRIRPLAKEQQWDQVRHALRDRSPLDRLAAIYLEHLETTAAIRDDIVRREGILLLNHWEKRLHWLTAIGQLSPMLGLLGTVTGLVTAFHQVEVHGGQVQPADLASGIWEALLTTVFGLVIAIPALAGRHILQQRLDARAQDFALLITYLDEWRLAGDRRGPTPIPRAQERPVAHHA